jgi:eukaryotic-like serine/threonine-protein kinase
MARRKLKIGMPVTRDITVLDVVDDGGRDAVYLVWDHRAWCPMACKVYDLASDALHEVTVLLALEHPNIVRSLGAGSPGYVLMEYLDGPTLKQLIQSTKAGRLSLSNAMRIGIYIGSALVHMHSRGYLHLDVKPSNIVIYRGRPVLFDLGTAQLRSQPQLTCSVGTNDYMSPEQCERGQVSPASDVFGFGVTLYQMLTGKLPYPEGLGQVFWPQTRVDALPLRTYLPRAPRALEALLQACLDRSASARPAFDELLPALHRFIYTGPKMWPASFDPAAKPLPTSRIKDTDEPSPPAKPPCNRTPPPEPYGDRLPGTAGAGSRHRS